MVTHGVEEVNGSLANTHITLSLEGRCVREGGRKGGNERCVCVCVEGGIFTESVTVELQYGNYMYVSTVCTCTCTIRSLLRVMLYMHVLPVLLP